MTRQEMFTKAVRGLAKQGFRRSIKKVDGVWNCVYRGPNNKRCALGHCIPNTKYRPKWDEDIGTGGDVVCRAIGIRSQATINFAIELQSCHDDAETPAQMRANLRRLGELSELVWPLK